MHLLKILEETGRVIAKNVSQDLMLSEDTIRRDLRELAKEGYLKRVHGGAVPVALANASFRHRIDIVSPEKNEIGRRAALMIEPGQVVFVDGGTTALQLARQIPQHIEATIITHSPNVALELLNHEKLEVEIVGGRLYRHSIVTCGATTIAWLDRFRPDVCFIGASGIHADAGITTGNSEEAEVKRAVIARSGAAVLLASSEKLGAVSSFELARWSDIDGMVVSTAELEIASEMFARCRCEIYALNEKRP
ncbi:MAG: DeoR/GlpR family DNA-binding transcription regulator [Hyphomicrobiales bacterium]